MSLPDIPTDSADAMAALHARCFTLPRPWSAAEFSDLLADRSVFALTLPGAFLLGRSVLDEAEILTLAVAPEARRQGLARQLLSQFHSAAMGRGAARAFLEVAETNAPAIALYQNVGWQQAGRRRAYFTAPGQVPQDALVMTISLDASATNGA